MESYGSYYDGVVALFLFIIAIVLIYYVLYAIGLMRIALSRGYGGKAIFAWVPLFSTWLVGDIVKDGSVTAFNFPHFGVVCVGVSIMTIVLSSLPLLGTLAALGAWAFNIIVTAELIGGITGRSSKWAWAILFPALGVYLASREV